MNEQLLENREYSPDTDLDGASAIKSEELTEPTDEPTEPAELQEEPDTQLPDTTDCEELIRSDIASLKKEFPELYALSDITELENPMRYAELRDLGLTPKEAYLASTQRRRVQDSRAHLSGAVPRGAAAPRSVIMSQKEMASARELFADLSDAEIYKLYKRVKNQ